jgi:hypothetical protein
VTDKITFFSELFRGEAHKAIVLKMDVVIST